MVSINVFVMFAQVRLSNILVHLSRMQEFYSSQEFPARNNNTVSCHEEFYYQCFIQNLSLGDQMQSCMGTVYHWGEESNT